MTRPLMTAQWLDLLIASYRVDAALLTPHLPRGLELLERDGAPWVSLVAFDFNRVRMWGVPVPGHTRFPEWNLRFYVRTTEHEPRHGVVFIRELAPRRLVSLGAKLLYNEPYQTWPMSRTASPRAHGTAHTHTLRHRSGAMTLGWITGNEQIVPDEASEAHFFKEHSWGFGRTRSGNTMIYRVDHPVWTTREITSLAINLDGRSLYGNDWAFIGQREPDSVLFADGSDVKVYPGERL